MTVKRTMVRLTGVGMIAALSIAPAVQWAAPAIAQVPFGTADFSGFATGTVVHADAIEDAASGTRVADVEEAFSGASVNSRGLDPAISNEVSRIVQPALSGKFSYGRGSGIEIGAGVTPSSDNQVILAAKVEASAPPSPASAWKELGPLPADPLAYASLLRGKAAARWNDAACVLGSDLAEGLGYAADAQVLDQDGEPDGPGDAAELEEPVIATDAPNPTRAVAQSTSHLRLVPQVNRQFQVEGAAFGLMAETRMTIAPITLGGQVTVEFLGEWVLRAVATGKSGYVHYGPGTVSPETPILRLIDQATGKVTNVLTTQQFFGPGGLVVPIPQLGIEIAVGEDPRAIGGDASSNPTETATLASAALDVVRIRLLDLPEQGGTASDIRIGHMEVRAAVPEGGISCGLGVTKTVDKEVVAPGEEFTYTITVNNPFDCTLTDVKATDTLSATPGVTYEILGQDPPANSVQGNTVTWNDVGPIAPGGSKSLTLRMRAGSDTAAGRVTNNVVVTASCGVAAADGVTQVKVPVEGRASIDLPRVEVTQVLGQTESRPEGALPRTGGPLTAALPLALLMGAALARRWRPRS